LKQKGIFVAVINPLMMKKYSNLTLRKGKTEYEIMTSLNAIKPVEYSGVYDYMLKKESEGKAKKWLK